MIGSLGAGTQVWIAGGVTDMRKGFDGLAALVQTTLLENPFSGHVFVFRGKRGDLLKLLWWSGDGLNLFSKRLERGRSYGHRPRAARCTCPPRSCRCCSRALIGGSRSARGNRIVRLSARGSQGATASVHCAHARSRS